MRSPSCEGGSREGETGNGETLKRADGGQGERETQKTGENRHRGLSPPLANYRNGNGGGRPPSKYRGCGGEGICPPEAERDPPEYCDVRRKAEILPPPEEWPDAIRPPIRGKAKILDDGILKGTRVKQGLKTPGNYHHPMQPTRAARDWGTQAHSPSWTHSRP